MSTSQEAGPSGFRSASSLLPPPAPTGPRASTLASGSLRNASNDEPQPSLELTTAPTPPPAAAPAAAVKPVNRSAASKRAIVYSAVQRRNPVLQALHNLKTAPTEIGDIPADYQVGTHNGLLFLSLKYHRLHPEYIHQRIEKIRSMYNYRILMVLCDVAEHQQSIRELAKIAILNDLAMIVAWSNDEVAQYLATFKSYENKSADTLKERVHQEYKEQLQHVLTTGKRVNKTDAGNLASQFGSFANIARQQAKALSGVKGLGAAKVTSLVEAFHKPFLAGGLKRKRKGADDTSASTIVPTPAVPEGAAVAVGAPVRKGKQRDTAGKDGQERGGDHVVEEVQVQVVDGDRDVEEIGSPDWPDIGSGSDDDGGGNDIAGEGNGNGNVQPRRRAEYERPRAPSPPRGRVRGRSSTPDSDSAVPGEDLIVSKAEGAGAVWRDFTDDDDDEEDEGQVDEPDAQGSREDEGGSRKRARI